MAQPRKTWSDTKGLALNRPIKDRAETGLRAAADWAVCNQVQHRWPRWNANAGRFPYHVYLPTDDFFWSNSWNTSRTVQGLLAAWRRTGESAYLDTANRGLEYVKSLQVFTPEYPRACGAFIEETPQGDHVGIRDGVECAQAFMAHFFATGNRVSLLRAGAYLDWFHKTAQRPNGKLKHLGIIYITPTWRPMDTSFLSDFFSAVAAIPLTQYAKVTREKKYVTHMAVPIVDNLIETFLESDGRLVLKSKDPINRHAPVAGDPTVYNDDGAGIAILAVWKATGKRRYLDAAVAMGDWWLAQDMTALPPLFALLPCLTIFLADLARATCDARYTQFIETFADRLFKLQVTRDARPVVDGAFQGEDMADDYRPGSSPDQYVCLRATSYGLIALAKLAARRDSDWTAAYSAFGY